MLFLGGSMNGWSRSVAPDQHTFAHRAPRVLPDLVGGHLDRAGWTREAGALDCDVYTRRQFAAEKRWRTVMVKDDLSDTQAQALLVEWLLARWVAEAREPDGGML